MFGLWISSSLFLKKRKEKVNGKIHTCTRDYDVDRSLLMINIT